jgi:hypothetical protein
MASPLQTSMPLTATTPSFFELFMADRLQRAISPAVGHTLAACAGHGGALGAWATWFSFYLDETNAVLLGALQASSLWSHGMGCDPFRLDSELVHILSLGSSACV